MLRIARFAAPTAAAVEQELLKIARAHGDKLAIDLRGVAGGDPEVAYQVADLLVAGDMGTLEARDQVRQRFVAGGEPVWKGRLVVLSRSRHPRGRRGAGPRPRRGGRRHPGRGADLRYAGHQGLVELGSGAVVELTDAFYTGPKGKPVDDSIEPDQEVDERSRTLREKDLTLDELILQRGVGALEKPAAPEPVTQKAA